MKYDNLLPRFLRYVQIETQSDPTSKTTPSTQSQVDFAMILKKELEELGMSDVFYNEANGFFDHLILMFGLEDHLNQ